LAKQGHGMTFDDVPMIEMLSTMDEAALDGLPFGVVGLDGENMVEHYNSTLPISPVREVLDFAHFG